MTPAGTIVGLVRAEGKLFGKTVVVHVAETHNVTQVLIDGQPADVDVVEAQFTFAGLHALALHPKGETAKLAEVKGEHEMIPCHVQEVDLNLSGFLVKIQPGEEGPDQQVTYRGTPVRGLELLDLTCKVSDEDEGGEGKPLTRVNAQFLVRRL